MPQQKPDVFLDDLSQAYINHCRANGKNGPWLTDLINLLNNQWIPRLTQKPVDELLYQDMIKFIEIYRDRSQTTRNRYFDYLKVIFNFWIRYGMTKSNPLAKWKKPKELPRQTLLTVEDLIKIHNHAEPHLGWCLEVVWFTGIRPGPKELFSLKWDSVDFDRNIIRMLGKRNLWREIPISGSFKEKLLAKKQVSQTEHLIEYNGRLLSFKLI